MRIQSILKETYPSKIINTIPFISHNVTLISNLLYLICICLISIKKNFCSTIILPVDNSFCPCPPFPYNDRTCNWNFPSCFRRYRGLPGCPGGPRAIHAATGSSLLGHFGVDFSEAGRHTGHAQIRLEERVSSHAEA